VSDFPQPGKERVSTVKKFIAMLLMGAVLATGAISITGCGGDDKKDKEKDKAKAKEKEKEKEK
jgi:hypothetical protein